MFKKMISVMLTAFLLGGLAGCAGNKKADPTQFNDLFASVISAEEALRRSKETGAVVIEGLECTAGENVWSDFYKTVSKGEPASILVARYYTLDPTRVSAELYEQEKNEYPKLFFYNLTYDGETYTVTVRESTEKTSEQCESYQYLLHLTGNYPPQAVYASYDYYVLADDPDATWEEIEAGMVSSQLGAGVRHCAVFQNSFEKREGQS